MVPKEALLRQLSECIQLSSAAPVHLRHQRETVARCGYDGRVGEEIARLLEGLTLSAEQHARALVELRQSVLGRDRDVL